MQLPVRDDLRTLQEHASDLTAYEQSEVLEVQDIYFWGRLATKVQGASLIMPANAR